MSEPVVIVSGCHGGPNPSAGLGIARSLRRAFPNARLIGRDFSPLASGLHDPVFDEVWLAPRWDEVDLDLQWSQLRERLDGAWLVSTLDLEVKWLAGRRHPRILTPPASAIAATGKPSIPAVADLPVKVPAWLPFAAGDRELHRFCRLHDWHVWVKGPAYEAVEARSWSELQAGGDRLGMTWSQDGLFVQAHVDGHGVSVAFAALKGELLDSVLLEKRDTTPEGKVWAGRIRPVPAEIAGLLRGVLRTLCWSGGGELEFIRDAAGTLWLIDWNPRFPAWVHGATLAGHNLPAHLLDGALGSSTGSHESASALTAAEFIRVVIEVPVRGGLALPSAAAVAACMAHSAKHPSGMPLLAKRLRGSEVRAAAGDLEPELSRDLSEIGRTDTPKRVQLRRTAERNFYKMRDAGDRLGVRIAYSIKTNPSAEFAALSRRSGFLAEAISPREVAWALAQGWKSDEIVYNGPMPLERGPDAGPLAAAFADSVDAFAAYAQRGVARVVGIRVRPPEHDSRFGVDVSAPDEFLRAAEVLRHLPAGVGFGVSVHVPSSDVGLGRWERLAGSVLEFGRALEDLTGRHVSMLNFGGGAVPEDLVPFSAALARLAARGRGIFHQLVAIITEPGKLLVQSAEAVVAGVVEIRSCREGAREVVVDACIGDLPMARVFPHRVALLRGRRVVTFGQGADRLLGRTCMEQDVLAEGLDLLPGLVPGDVIAFCDAGAYDASMAYPFGIGARGECAAHITR